MVNWAKPDVNSTKTTLPGEVQTGLDHAIKMDFTSDTNIPTGAIRFNTGKVAFESYNGSAWVRAFPAAGTISQGMFSSAPSGHVLLRGGTIGNASSGGTILASANAEDLFTALWNNSADAQLPVSSGRGASAAADFAANKTITLPDYRGRVPLGVAASGTGSTRAGTGGSIDHTHTMAHTHDMANHTHSISAHVHSVPAHFHDVNGAGATIVMSTISAAVAAHAHYIVANNSVNSNALTGSNALAKSSNAGTDFSYGFDNAGSTLTPTLAQTSAENGHAHIVSAVASDFAGACGNVSSGVNGNIAQSTGSAGAGSTTGISTNTTGAASSSTTSTGNQAFLATDFIIKL